VRALILDGARDEDRTLALLRAAVSEHLTAAGHDVAQWVLRETPVQPCDGDFICLVKTPGVCIHKDAGREIAKQFLRADVAVWLSPVTFGGCSAELSKAVDRLACPVICRNSASCTTSITGRPATMPAPACGAWE
jgi:multimeric flavodoxin WrbA